MSDAVEGLARPAALADQVVGIGLLAADLVDVLRLQQVGADGGVFQRVVSCTGD